MNYNPFEVIEARLNSIENLMLDLKHQSTKQIEPLEKFLTIQEAAQFLNLSVSTIYGKVSKREICFMKRGKRLYFSSVELMTYIKDGRQKTNSELEASSSSYLKIKGGQNV